MFQGKCEMIDEKEEEKTSERHKRSYRKSNVLEEIYEENK